MTSIPLHQRLASPDESEVLEALQSLDEQDLQPGCVISCLDLLASPSEEIRTWAAEVLSRPTTVSEAEISELALRLQRWATFSSDQVYWAATLLGRAGIDASAARSAVIAAADAIDQVHSGSGLWRAAAKRCRWADQQIGSP